MSFIAPCLETLSWAQISDGARLPFSRKSPISRSCLGINTIRVVLTACILRTRPQTRSKVCLRPNAEYSSQRERSSSANRTCSKAA